MSALIRCLAIVAAVLATSPVGVAKTVPDSLAAVQLSFAPVVKATAPAVVNVYSQQHVQQNQDGLMNDPFFRQFFGDGTGARPRPQVQNSLGSGVIVDPKGLIITNNHVVRGGTSIRVVLADKREFPAKLLLTDERTDLAVLKIEVGDEALPALTLGNSDSLEVGDLVLAIGNPFGVGQTVTSGIVSALARTQVGVSDYQFFIQTDAAINPGNSGGALVSMAGDLVGINTAIFSKSGGSIGIGFAIPSNMVRTVVESAEAGKAVKRPWLGAELQEVTQDIADHVGLARPEGALIVNLHPDSPLARAGLQRGDIVLAIEGKPVEGARELGYRVATSEIGATPIIEYQRAGKRIETRVTLFAAPESTPRETTLITGKNPMAGALAENLSPAVADELGLAPDAQGVAITRIKGGPAQNFFKPGDVVLDINGVGIDNVAKLMGALAANQGFWRVAISRNGRILKLAFGG